MSCGLQAALGIGGGSNGSKDGDGTVRGSRTSSSDPSQGVGPGDGSDIWTGNAGKLNKSDKELDSKANANPEMRTSMKRETGDETYIEVRGPATLGKPSSVPMSKALPKYQKRAEEAINKKRIPKSKQKRVREYFNSLQGSNK